MWNFRYSSLPKLVNFMITPANNSKLQRSASIDTLLWLVIAYETRKLKPCFALNVLLKLWIAAAFSSRISHRTPLVSLCVEVWGLKIWNLKLNDCTIAPNRGRINHCGWTRWPFIFCGRPASVVWHVSAFSKPERLQSVASLHRGW